MSTPEFYPMPMFPILAVNDAAASARWYQEALGFAHVFTIPGPGGAPLLAHLRFARYADLLLRPGTPTADKKGSGITLNFAVAENLDVLAERAREHGATFLQEPGDRPWNARDFTIADPDGFALTFTHGPLNQNRTMDEIVASAQTA